MVLIAGWDGEAQVKVAGVDVRLFRARALPGLGFSGLVSAGLQSALQHHVREFDVVHIHLGRHLIALAAAGACRRHQVPYVLQTHGMVIEDARPQARVADTLAVRRTLRNASAVLALTDEEESSLSSVSRGEARVIRIRNGVAPVTDAGGHARAGAPEVLFLARLHPRKRVMAFAEAAAMLHDRGISARFSVVGPDEGDLDRLLAFMSARADLPLSYDGPVAPGHSVRRLAAADVYVLPSVREVFPMTVLESISVGTPVVLTEDCGIAHELAEAGAAVISTGTAADIAGAVESILSSATRRHALAEGMRKSLAEDFGIATVAAALLSIYADRSVA
ncbi:putative teichuronic acid biosynthesis glycosyltransferase TuaC [Clavibacter michiganensis]|uniref:Putative teichuronic acid biosynthesis glycosyltransferase TuaC n=1 Tax=Clavibacter michiganensis TaxID=28447 RepID=A0A251XU63_9MICO|nr:putative teichuronic acid biosynthesis glycosyltransferase TuaC [Clavibacter michiganensis]